MANILPKFFIVVAMVFAMEGRASDFAWEGETVYIFGSQDKAFLTPGAARFISADEIQKFDYGDPMRLLQTIAGVHLQEEDGLGLRPNVGLRGATPHRSKKITLMEDGILIAPAPYSAPAAYFFPNMMKTGSVEVYKGPSSVKYGPNSVGGSINFVTHPIPFGYQSEIMASYGTVRKYRLSTGGMKNKFGYLFEYNGMDSDGIKTLPDGSSTGFEKSDFMFKGNYRFGTYGQSISLKTSYAYEQSRETYLGLTLQDFHRSPYSRYAASSNDLMKWKHRQYQLRYSINPNENLEINASLYYHKFARDWSKFNGFKNGVTISNYLNPRSTLFDPHFLRVLRGESDSVLDNGDDEVVIGNNNRSYYSGGALLRASFLWRSFDDIYHDTVVGFRYHQDQIKRFHTKDNFEMKNGQLIPSRQKVPSTQNIDTSFARMFFIEDRMDFSNGLLVSLGFRFEEVEGARESWSGESQRKDSYYKIFSPGLGIQYSPSANLNLIAGMSKGVSGIAPGQSSVASPEESINYEVGIKYGGDVRGELIGFFNDYKNIKGFCSFSSGCEEQDLDREFDGGKAHVYGVEGRIFREFDFLTFDVPIEFNYTKTLTRFLDQAKSFNREWGLGVIRKGDPLPYIPEDKFSLSFGAKGKKFSTFLIYNGQSSVHDQSVREGRQAVPAYDFIDWSAKYRYSKNSEVFVRIDNLLAKKYIVSLRPLGARPGKPRSFNLGLKYVF